MGGKGLCGSQWSVTWGLAMLHQMGHFSGMGRDRAWRSPWSPYVTYLRTSLVVGTDCPVRLATRAASRLGVHDAISSLRPLLQCNYSFPSHLAGPGSFGSSQEAMV